MGTFATESRDARGRTVKRRLEAGSQSEAIRLLELEGLYPLEVRELRAAPRRSTGAQTRADDAPSVRAASEGRVDGRVRSKHLMNFSMQLSSATGAGVPIHGALSSIAKQTPDRRFRTVLEQMCEDLQAGQSLSAAMRNHPRAFPEVYASTVAAGEESGSLDDVLEHLSEFLEAEMEVRADVRAALLYPAVVVAAIGLAVTVLIVFVVPRFTTFYSGFDTELPLPTRMLVAASGFVQRYLLVITAVLFVAGYGLLEYMRTPAGKRALDRFLLRVPLIRHLVVTANTLQVAQMLGLFTQAGVPLMQGLQTVATTTPSAKIRDDMKEVVVGIASGESLAKSLEVVDCLSPTACQMLASGEATGSLEQACFAVARHLKKELRYLTKNLGTLIEPILTVALAGIVLFVALAVFLPMWDLVKVVG